MFIKRFEVLLKVLSLGSEFPEFLKLAPYELLGKVSKRLDKKRDPEIQKYMRANFSDGGSDGKSKDSKAATNAGVRRDKTKRKSSNG